MALKLTTGAKKGITLLSTKESRELRPTQSIVREALINMIQNGGFIEGGIPNTKILDLYAGIGTVGLEFLSSGSATATFIEKDPRCVRILRSNIKKLGFHAESNVIAKPVLDGLKRLSSGAKAEPFDIIFADAPYKSDDFLEVVKLVLNEKLLKKDGLFIWEDSDKNLSKLINTEPNLGLELLKEKNYGDTQIYLLKN